LPGTIISLGIAMMCFSCVGFAVTSLVPTAEAALPIAYGTFLPLSFVSDVFFPSDTSPAWLRHVASVFPIRPLAEILAATTSPTAHGAGLHWVEMATLVMWTAGAAALLTMFRWEPFRPSRRPRRVGRLRRARTQGDAQ
jgi:ABC-2 type transport system permease protein